MAAIEPWNNLPARYGFMLRSDLDIIPKTWEWTERPAQPIIMLDRESFSEKGMLLVAAIIFDPVVISKKPHINE